MLNKLLILSFFALNADAQLGKVLPVVTKYVSYYQEFNDELNVDVLQSLRVLQGHLQHLLDIHQNSFPEANDVQALGSDIDQLITSTMFKVIAKEPDYMAKYRRSLMTPWQPQFEYRIVDIAYKWPESELIENLDFYKDKMNCFLELLQDRPYKCKLDKKCLLQMTNTKGLSGYNLLQQINYLVMATQFDCSQKVDLYLHSNSMLGGTKELALELCTNAFYLISPTVKHGQIQDVRLFMELSFSCPMLGFMQFLHNDWLRQITNQQLPSGCFKVKENPGACNNHMGSLYVKALSQYLRLLAEPGSKRYRKIVQVTGHNHLREVIHLHKNMIAEVNGEMENVAPWRSTTVVMESPQSNTSYTLYTVICFTCLVLVGVYYLHRKSRGAKYNLQLPLLSPARHSKKAF